MKAEEIMDAIDLLPDDILEETNAKRQRKRIPWRSLTAIAACLCLVMGLWFAFPGAKSEDNAAAEAGSQLEDFAETWQESTSECYAVFTVVEVFTDRMTVVPGRQEALCDCLPQTVSFELLDEIPQLEPGQFIRLYLVEEGPSPEAKIPDPLIPYKIEIEEE